MASGGKAVSIFRSCLVLMGEQNSAKLVGEGEAELAGGRSRRRLRKRRSAAHAGERDLVESFIAARRMDAGRTQCTRWGKCEQDHNGTPSATGRSRFIPCDPGVHDSLVVLQIALAGRDAARSRLCAPRAARPGACHPIAAFLLGLSFGFVPCCLASSLGFARHGLTFFARLLLFREVARFFAGTLFGRLLFLRLGGLLFALRLGSFPQCLFCDALLLLLRGKFAAANCLLLGLVLDGLGWRQCLGLFGFGWGRRASFGFFRLGLLRRNRPRRLSTLEKEPLRLPHSGRSIPEYRMMRD